MARSYKSALPTWSTYTPHVGQMGIQAPINQEVIWRNRAQRWVPPSTAGQFNRFARENAGAVAGTGSASVTGLLTNRPIFNAVLNTAAKYGAGSSGDSSDPRRGWAGKMQEAINQPPAPQQQAPRTAPATVNPVNVMTQQAARGTVAAVAGQAVSSNKAGTSTGPARMITGTDLDQLNLRFKSVNEP